MKVFTQQVELRFKKSNDLQEEIEVIRRFSEEMNGWIFDDKQSEQYATENGSPSCILQFNNGAVPVFFLIAPRKSRVYHIANIFPMQDRNTEYNNFLIKFADDFQCFIRKFKVSACKIYISPEEIGIDEIISSKKVRILFARFVNVHPFSYHPSDIKRLDVFICAAARYCRKSINISLLRRYLIEDLHWTCEDAKWCHDRIETGLDILNVNKSFD